MIEASKTDEREKAVDATLKECRDKVSSGREYETVQSKKNCLKDEKTGVVFGGHFILQFKGSPEASTVDDVERDELSLRARRIAIRLSQHFTPGVYQIATRSPLMATNTHDHIHIICPDEPKLRAHGRRVRRLVDDMTAPELEQK